MFVVSDIQNIKERGLGPTRANVSRKVTPLMLPEPQPQKAGDKSDPQRQQRILVVDDVTSNRIAICRLLAKVQD